MAERRTPKPTWPVSAACTSTRPAWFSISGACARESASTTPSAVMIVARSANRESSESANACHEPSAAGAAVRAASRVTRSNWSDSVAISQRRWAPCSSTVASVTAPATTTAGTTRSCARSESLMRPGR